MKINGCDVENSSLFNLVFYVPITVNKCFEFQSYWCSGFSSWFGFNIGWSRKGDHSGAEIKLDILGFYLCTRVYDIRHWNWEKNRFFYPDEESAASDVAFFDAPTMRDIHDAVTRKCSINRKSPTNNSDDYNIGGF